MKRARLGVYLVNAPIDVLVSPDVDLSSNCFIQKILL